MLGQDKLTRDELLKKLDISGETLSLYEHELEIDVDPLLGGLGTFTEEDLHSIHMFHKLRESGLTYSEIKLLASFSEVLKNVDFQEHGEIKNLLKLSPVYRLKQSLNLSRQEINLLKGQLQEIEDALSKEIEKRTSFGKESDSSLLAELEIRQKAINNLDRKLSEVLQQKNHLETELALYKEAKVPQIQLKGKKAKELYQTLLEKEAELLELKKKNEEILSELEEKTSESSELLERLELMEDGIAEMEHEIEERYQEQIESLRAQIEGLVDKKQKEWETYYIQSSDQHRKELLTLQRKHEQDIQRLKLRLKQQFEEIEELKIFKNPLKGLLKIGERLR